MENTKTLALAKYLVAIATNTVTEKVLTDILSVIDKTDSKDLNEIGRSIILTVFDNLNPTNENFINAENAIEVIETQYYNIGIEAVLGDFSQYTNFLTKLAILKYNGYDRKEILSIFKELVEIVDISENPCLCMGTYLAALTSLVKRGLITEDLEFSKKIISYVDKADTVNYTNTVFYDVIFTVI